MNTKSIWFKAIALALCLTVFGSGFVASAAEETEEVSGYSITNPYADINWETVNQYKSAFHTHTQASDGDDTLFDSLERHYETGFDIVATTDHSVLNYSWVNTDNAKNLITDVMKLVGRTEGNIVYLQEKGSFVNGMGYEVQVRDGEEYLVTADGHEILRIPYGTENNGISVNAHVNSWFAEFNRSLGDYDDAIRGAHKAGGLSVINHPGEYTQARYELYQEDAYDPDNATYNYFINKFYGYIDKYDSCLGIDINSKGDSRTRYDRKLWDLLLAKAAKEGDTVTAIASSDAHQLDKIDTGSLIVLSEELTVPAVKSAMQKGELLPQSTCIYNRDELDQIATALKEFYGETELQKEIAALVVEYDIEREEKDKSGSDSQVGVGWSALDDEGFLEAATRPEIKSIKVDDTQDTITIDTENALLVRWISDGKVIATTKADDKAFDLNDYEDQINGYVRAEVFGEGGIVYTEGFTLNAEYAEEDGRDIIIDLGFLDFIFPMLNKYIGLLGRIIGNLFE